MSTYNWIKRKVRDEAGCFKSESKVFLTLLNWEFGQGNSLLFYLPKVYLCVCYVFCLSVCTSLVPTEGTRTYDTGVMDDCALPWGCWEPNLVPLEEQQMVLTVELSLQPEFSFNLRQIVTPLGSRRTCTFCMLQYLILSSKPILKDMGIPNL